MFEFIFSNPQDAQLLKVGCSNGCVRSPSGTVTTARQVGQNRDVFTGASEVSLLFQRYISRQTQDPVKRRAGGLCQQLSGADTLLAQSDDNTFAL